MIAVSLLTTVVAVGLAADLLLRAGSGRPQVRWWALGVIVYGTGTGAAAWVGRYGWSPAGLRVWYIAGAILGGSVLALGSVHLVHRPPAARQITQTVMTVALGAAVATLMSPVAPLPDQALGGASIAWIWVRALTPLLNGFAVAYLVGAASHSALRRIRRGEGSRRRVAGNAMLAAGGITPAMGGIAARFGGADALPPALLAGLVLIWAGARLSASPTATSRAAPPPPPS